MKKIEKQLYRLRILDELQFYHFLKSGLDEGVVEISTDPSLEEEQVRYSEHVTLAHVECWNVARAYAHVAKKDLPKKLRDEPLDMMQAERVSGAVCALDWFLSGEKDRLATYLNVTAQENAPEKS
jgi:hypothetical protein